MSQSRPYDVNQQFIGFDDEVKKPESSTARFFLSLEQPKLGYFEQEFASTKQLSSEALEAKIQRDNANYENYRNDRANLIYVNAPLGSADPRPEEIVRESIGLRS